MTSKVVVEWGAGSGTVQRLNARPQAYQRNRPFHGRGTHFGDVGVAFASRATCQATMGACHYMRSRLPSSIKQAMAIKHVCKLLEPGAVNRIPLAGLGWLEEVIMIGTILIIILILLLIGALPTWPYSTGWGYYPGGGIGLILIIIVVLVLVGRI